MNEVTGNMIYENGNRVETVTRTSTRADDAQVLGNCYFQLSSAYRRLASAKDEAAIDAFTTEILALQVKIAEYRGYLEGYDRAETDAG